MKEIVNLEDWPIDRLESAEGQALVARCQADLAADGMFNLAGFLRPDAISGIVADVTDPLENDSFRHARKHNIYFKKTVEGLPPDHAVLMEFETSNNTICADQFEESPLFDLYMWEPFRAFLAAVMGKERLYPMNDMLACANVMSYGEKQALNWHFDRSEFTTTLLLQAPDIGGDFQYSRNLRSDEDPNFPGVLRLLLGEDDNMRTLKLAAGTLNVFMGKNTAHRVTPVSGNSKRIIAVFSYFEEPGRRFSDEEHLGFYGRTL